MALESSGMILYVAKISNQSDNWFGKILDVFFQNLMRMEHFEICILKLI